MTVNRIWADAHDLGIVIGELGQIPAVRRHLAGSSRAPIQRIKSDHDVLFSTVVAEFDLVSLLAGYGGEVKKPGGGSRFFLLAQNHPHLWWKTVWCLARR